MDHTGRLRTRRCRGAARGGEDPWPNRRARQQRRMVVAWCCGGHDVGLLSPSSALVHADLLTSDAEGPSQFESISSGPYDWFAPCSHRCALRRVNRCRPILLADDCSTPPHLQDQLIQTFNASTLIIKDGMI